MATEKAVGGIDCLIRKKGNTATGKLVLQVLKVVFLKPLYVDIAPSPCFGKVAGV
jgi:hypothetical protein